MVSQKSQKKKISPYLWVILFSTLFLFAFNISLVINNVNLQNEAALYCELANVNGGMFNNVVPYFQDYLEESIETVSNINKTLGDMLDLSLIGKRDLEYSPIECPDPNCKLSFINKRDELLCDTIYELRYG